MSHAKLGRHGVATDLSDILRALRRAERDSTRPAEVNKQLCHHLRQAIRILTDAEAPASTNGAKRKSVAAGS